MKRSAATKPLRVVIADDHTAVRSGLRHLLDGAPDVKVVGEAADGVQALKMVETLAPDVLVLDVEMPEMDGLEVAARLHEAHSPVHILALSAYKDKQYIQGMLENGVKEYITKDEAPPKLLNTLRQVAARK